MKFIYSWFAFLSLAILAGCSCTKNTDGSETCTLTASCSSRVTGYVLYSGIKPGAGNQVILQWSDDSFATHTYTGTSVINAQGFPAVPFAFDANYTCGTVPTIQIRAYESLPKISAWMMGDPVGRCDGTFAGNAAYTSILASSATNIQFAIDSTGAQ